MVPTVREGRGERELIISNRYTVTATRMISRIKMDSDVSRHFNVLLIVQGKVTETVSINNIFLRER